MVEKCEKHREEVISAGEFKNRFQKKARYFFISFAAKKEREKRTKDSFRFKRLLLLIGQNTLDLESSGRAASTTSLVLTVGLSLGTDVRNGMLTMDSTEVLEDLTSAAGTLKQNSLATSGALESELIEGHDLTAGLLDAGTGRLSDVESSDSDLGDSEDALIISDGTDDDEDSLGRLTLGVSGDLLEGDGRSVVTGHNQATEDNLVEVSLSTASQELVQLFVSNAKTPSTNNPL